MKLYNRYPGAFKAIWNAEDKVDDKGRPEMPVKEFHCNGNSETPDLPPLCAQYLLAAWPRRFTADKQALNAEIKLRADIEAKNQKLADMENHLAEIKSLMAIAGDPKNKKAATEAAKRLDELLSTGPVSRQGPSEPAAPAAPEPAPAPTPELGKSEQETFESPADNV